jgi:2-dehydro-3-deoxygalactonokinase
MTDPRPSFVGIDWGSSRLRAYAIAEDGAVLGKVTSDAGVLRTDRTTHHQILSTLLADWRERWGAIPLLASGMIGSRQGVREVPYVPTPAGPRELTLTLVTMSFAGTELTIVPGLVHRRGKEVDVLRGEETIAIGWQAEAATDQALSGRHILVLPGTHSKWVMVHGGGIVGFTTFMTGELRDLLSQSASIGALLPEQPDHTAWAEGFEDGVDQGLASGGLLHDTFTLRAAVVAGARSGHGLDSELTGLLIGSEIAEARRMGLLASGQGVQLVSTGGAATAYEAAFNRAGVPVRRYDSERCLVRGWQSLAQPRQRDAERRSD